ncbi:unnamed protein product [Mycena citricolor]|uniref:Endonuclease/exonuclease/phosphatase domain-containing protein n=1 Tax=Mycena citricolor TaxID=2018698 RepID=A0AAD2HVR2_9AGAR|nr:unnamed protein product [Mycena citricolor]
MPHITGSSVLGLEIEANQWQQDRLNRFRADPGENARRAELRKAQRAADALLAASTSASEPSRNDSPSIMPSPSSPIQLKLDLTPQRVPHPAILSAGFLRMEHPLALRLMKTEEIFSPVLFLPGHAIRVPASDDFILAAPIGWEVPLSESSSSPLQKGSDSPLVNLLVESGDGVHYRGVCAVKSLLNAQKYILDESILQGVKSSSSSQKLQGEAQERVIVQFYGLQSRTLTWTTYHDRRRQHKGEHSEHNMQILPHTDSTRAHSQAMRFVTYNLRYDSRPDTISVAQSLTHLPDPLDSPRYLAKAGEQPWSTRRLRVAEHLLGEGIVLAGFQEALVRQVRDLHELLGEADWDWVGVGRDDGREAGEYSAVFYKKSELEYLGHDSFWTSLTPFTPSRYPGAGSIRVCTVLQLQRRHGGQKFTVLNTHMDERSEEQRRLAASMILARARFEAHTSGFPVIVMGDFNRFASPGALYLRRLTFCRSPPTGSDSGAYEISTGMRLPVDVPTDFAERYSVPDDAAPFVLRDLRGCTPRRHVSANHATFTGFSAPNDARAWSRIDFIFGGSNGGWESVRYKVDSALTDDGVLASDHRPVFADLVL